MGLRKFCARVATSGTAERADGRCVRRFWMVPIRTNGVKGISRRRTSNTTCTAKGSFTVKRSYEHDREDPGEGEWTKRGNAGRSRDRESRFDGDARLEREFRNAGLPRRIGKRIDSGSVPNRIR